MKTKKTIIIILSLLIVIATISIFICRQYINRNNKDTIKIGYNIESVDQGAIIVAYEKEIFAKHNIQVQLIPFKSGKETQQALALGQIDIGSAGATNFLIPIAKGAPVKIIAPGAVAPTLVFVRPDSKIKTLHDLIGKSVASRLGENSNLALGFALKKEGIKLQDIEFLDIDKPLRPLALMEKETVDAAVATEYEEKIYLEYGAIPLEEWQTKGYINKTFPRAVIAVNTDYFNENKKDTESFIDSLIESQRFIKDNPDEAAKIISEHIDKGSNGAVKFSAEEVKNTWIEMKYILWYDPNDLMEVAEMAKEVGNIESVPSLNEIFDFSFKEKLINAQNEIYPSIN